MFFAPFEKELMEGVAFAGDGIVVTSETSEIFLFNAKAFRAR